MRSKCDGKTERGGGSNPTLNQGGPMMSGPLRNKDAGYHSPHRAGTSGNGGGGDGGGGDADSLGNKSEQVGNKSASESSSGTTTTTPPPGSAVTSTAGTATTTTAAATTATQRREEIPAGNGHPTNRGSKACCFCWCCCCSCSWKDNRCLTVRNNEENNARSHENNTLEILNGDNDAPPSLEEIRSWGESFDKLMRCSAGRKVFRDFLKCEYSEENILFWLACEDLKREPNSELVGEKARIIYEDYISILSPKEVSLDSRVREVINRNMVEPSPHTFDEAQLQIYTLMHRDSYPRFVNSPMFKKLAQLNNSSRKESSA